MADATTSSRLVDADLHPLADAIRNLQHIIDNQEETLRGREICRWEHEQTTAFSNQGIRLAVTSYAQRVRSGRLWVLHHLQPRTDPANPNGYACIDHAVDATASIDGSDALTDGQKRAMRLFRRVVILSAESDELHDACAAALAALAAKPPGAEPPRPFVPLFGWGDIIGALNHQHADGKAHHKNDERMRDHIRRLNEEFAGPIQFRKGKGTQPSVDKSAFLTWWNGLREQHDARNEQRVAKAESERLTVAESHNYGASGTVLPGIRGSVKATRKGKNGKGRKG